MSLLEMTITGSFMILIILIIRSVLIYKISKNTFLLFWFAAAVRLVFPLSVPSSLSIYSIMEKLMVKSSENHGVVSDFIGETWTSIPVGEGIYGEQISTISGTTVIWLVGMVLTLMAFVITYGICFFYLRKSYPVSNCAIEKWTEDHKTRRKICFLQNDRLTSPLTYGVICPKIITPSSMDWDNTEQNNLILEHEFCHIRRFDFLLKMAMAAVTCIHWFNPMVWIMYFIFQRDLELSCDEYVVRKKGFGMRSQYAHTLITAEENQCKAVSVCGEFHFRSTKERIKAVMLLKPISKGKRFVSLLLLGVIVLSFLTTGNASAVSVVSDVSEIKGAVIQSDPVIPQTTPPVPEKEEWVCPMEYTRVSSPFGDRVHPITKKTFTHEGVDLAAPEGTAVVASRSGVVSESGYDRTGGNFLTIDHGDGYITIYSHLNEVYASLGQTVSAGDEIGNCGNTGMSTGPHLSFFIYHEGGAVDPMQYIG